VNVIEEVLFGEGGGQVARIIGTKVEVEASVFVLLHANGEDEKVRFLGGERQAPQEQANQ
jgi:hypothetical protein